MTLKQIKLPGQNNKCDFTQYYTIDNNNNTALIHPNFSDSDTIVNEENENDSESSKRVTVN